MKFILDPIMKEIFQSEFRTEQLFNEGTLENIKNGHLVDTLCKWYNTNAVQFEKQLPNIVIHIKTLIDQNTKRTGFLKSTIDFKINNKQLVTTVEFSEPKPRKKDKVIPIKIIELGKTKQNKKPLF